jgi:hypothetical protein
MLSALRRLARPAQQWKPRAALATTQQSRPLSSIAPTDSPESHLDGHATTTEFDGDAADFVPKEVSVHDRRQTQLTSAQKEEARLHDYNGNHRRSAQSESGLDEPLVPPFFEPYDPAKHGGAQAEADEAVMVAEDERDK